MNTKRLFQSMACAILAFAVTAPVLARDHDRGRDRDRSSHHDRRDDRRDWREDRRDDRRDYRDQRQAYRHGYHDGRRYDDRRYYAPPRVVYRPAPPSYHRWAKGQRYRDYYRGPVYVVNDYNRYHVRHPPRGYHWVRDDRGNLLMVAIATGIIADLLLHH
ncbi:RcnB family protein [uncultured Pseudoxanthomonas sp.]|uniref:RcnB family protein n=1 Tax=uncultured Pseudoxanthomonas sp. TaxID=281701 RepID=UPI00260EAA57|nr:RcnB family protein [uncultured Pseudoxanthomonas sp.]